MTVRVSANHPLVSVIIPAYNYGHFVLSAINSVLQQDYPRIEIIVIDDGSTDNTSQILSDLPGITYIRQENQGLSAARNHGLQCATGKYLQFLDADDLLGPRSVRNRVEFLEANVNCSAVICRSAFFQKHVLPEQLAFLHDEWPQPENGCVDLALYYLNIAPPHAFLIRKSALDIHKLEFDTRLRACEDYDFWFRLAQLTGVPAMVRTCWVFYRQHASSMSRSYVNQYRHDAEMCRRIRATVIAESSWLGERPHVDYLVAMFAASVITARHLWQVDRPSFSDFFSDHLLPLLQQLEEVRQETSVTGASLWYFAQARINLLRMWLRDHSLTQEKYKQLAHPLFFTRSFFMLALSGVSGQISVWALVRLLKLDLRYIVLLLFFRRKNTVVLSDEG